MENITDNVRSGVYSTSHASPSVLFVIEGDFGGGKASLQWSEENGAGARWSDVKDKDNLDVAPADDTNGVVAVGRVGYLSVIVSGATNPDLYLSILSR